MRCHGIFLLIIFVFIYPFYLSADDSREKSSQKADKTSLLIKYLDVAYFFKETGEYSRGISVLKAAAAFRKDIRLNIELGEMSYLCGQTEEALRIFARIKNKDWVSLFYLGLIYEDLGDINKAIKNYRESIKLKENSNAYFRLGKIYRERKQYELAIDAYSSLLSIDPSIRLAYYYLGDCLYKKGIYAEAYNKLSKAINFYPKTEIIDKKFKIVKDKLGKDFFIAKQKSKEEKRKAVRAVPYKREKDIPYIKVGLAKKLDKFSFSCFGTFQISDETKVFKADANIFYMVSIKDKKVTLRDYENNYEYVLFTAPVKISSLSSKDKNFPFYVFDVGYGQDNFWHKKIDRMFRGDLEVILDGEEMTLINYLSVEEYLYGVLAAEMPSYAGKEALKAQAIAARTVVFRNIDRHKKEGFNICADVHCQVYHGLSGETTATNKAVQGTRGKVVMFNDVPVQIFYHSNCGGCLSADTFGNIGYVINKIDAVNSCIPNSSYQEYQWFREVPDTFCASGGGSKIRWQRIYDAEDFRIAFGFELNNLRHIIPRDKGDCFHYKQIDVITSKGKNTLKGDLKIRNYFDRLKSTAFKTEMKLSNKKIPEMLFFWGAGFGHGAGLCQEGAMKMAEEGYKCRQILKHYYPKGNIEKIY